MKWNNDYKKSSGFYLLILLLFFILCLFAGHKILSKGDSIFSDSLLVKKLSDFPLNFSLDLKGVPELTSEDKEYLMSVAYSAVDNHFKKNKSEPKWSEKFDGIKNKVFIGFRVKGKKKGSWSAGLDNLVKSVYVATQRTLKDERFDGAITEDDVSDLKIEILILGDLFPLNNNYEPGIHGLRFEKGTKAATYYNTVAIEGNYKTEKLKSKLCQKAKLAKDCYKDPSVNKYYFNTLHFATTRFSEKITTFYRGNDIDFVPEITLEKIEHSMNLAKQWLINNVNDDGSFNYLYNPSSGIYSTGNNTIRQLMASRFLAEESQNNNKVQELHKKNLEYVFSNWYVEEDGIGYIYYDAKSKLGANGMALRTLVFSPFFDNYKAEADMLASSIIKLQTDEGKLEPFLIGPNYTYDKEKLLNYYTGEAILGLVELYQKTGEQKYLYAAIKSQDYYLTEYVDQMDENYYPAYIPWHTISMYKIYKVTGDKKYLKAIFTLNDELIKMQNTNGEPYIDFLGRFYDPEHKEYGVPFSGSTAMYIEGLAYAYELAVTEQDKKRQDAYVKSILLGVHNLINLQYEGDNMYYLQHPERVKGAIKYRVDDNRIRIDTTQHTVDAFMKILSLKITS